MTKFNIDLGFNKAQQRILAMAIVVTAAILIFWLLIYIPARNKMVVLEKDYVEIKGEIEAIEKVAGGDSNLHSAYEKFYRRFEELEKMLGDDPSATIRELSSAADGMRIEVAAIKPEKPQKIALPIDIKNMTAEALPISVNLRCDYITCGEYLRFIQEKSRHLIAVRGVSIERPRRDLDKLDIWLKLTLFMLKKEGR